MNDENSPESRRALFVLAIWFGAAVASLIPFSLFSGGAASFPAHFSVLLLVLAASTLCGGLLGFLFGIPRSLQGDALLKRDATVSPGAEDKGPSEHAEPVRKAVTNADYIANTNLEQISDWLTKILVGVALTQVTTLETRLTSLVDAVTPAFNKVPAAPVFIGTLIIFGIVLGFLFGYLWTRLFLMGLLRQADRLGLLTAKAEAAERKVDELQKKAMQDANALHLAERQLRAQPGQPPVGERELTEALANASGMVKEQIFYLASDQRRRTWSDPSSKEIMELTIPVFRALIAIDRGREYHQNHGQLGYALKDSALPKYAEAEREFTTAIDIRDRRKERGWSYYELCRAICIIQQDENFHLTPQLRSNAVVVQKVKNDLDIALQDRYSWQIAAKDPVLTSWCALNGVSLGTPKSDRASAAQPA